MKIALVTGASRGIGLAVADALRAAGMHVVRLARSLRWVNSTTAAVTDEQVRVDAPACGTSCGTDDVYRLRAYETTGAIPRFIALTKSSVLQPPMPVSLSGEIFGA